MQGPCKTGEWLIYNSSLEIKDAVTCEPVPVKKCKLDGSQVFYKDQWESLGFNSAECGYRGTLKRDSDDWGIIKCFTCSPSEENKRESYYIFRPIGESVPRFNCPPTSKLAQNNQCRPIYTHGISQKRNIL